MRLRIALCFGLLCLFYLTMESNYKMHRNVVNVCGNGIWQPIYNYIIIIEVLGLKFYLMRHFDN